MEATLEYKPTYKKMGKKWIVIDKGQIVCTIGGPVGVVIGFKGIILHHGIYVNSYLWMRGRHPDVKEGDLDDDTVLLKFDHNAPEELLNQIVTDPIAAGCFRRDQGLLQKVMVACLN